MSQIHIVGLNLAKQIFQVHAISSEGALVVVEGRRWAIEDAFETAKT